MSRRLLVQSAVLFAVIPFVCSCGGSNTIDSGTVAGKISLTEPYNFVFKPEDMPIYLLGGTEKLDREHELLGRRIDAELGEKSAIDSKSERLGVKKYVDLANSLFAGHVVKEGKTDSEGRYRISGVPEGTYRLLFSFSTISTDPYSSQLVKKHYHWYFDVDVKAGETLTLNLNKYNARGKPYWDII